MNKKLLMILLAVLLAVVAVGCNVSGSKETGSEPPEPSEPQEIQAEELTIQHDLGEATIQKNPEKVVVFDFGVLDTLDKLGVEVLGVPQANIPPYLSKYEDAKYANVGSLKEPDFEKINELDPDVIIISGRQSAAYEELNKIAPTIFMGVDTAKYMESFTHNVTTLGEIFGKESEVEQELADINEAIEALHETAAASGKNALITLATGGKVSAYGSGSRFGILHDVFGLTPVDENIEVSTHGMSISFEYIVDKDPDYLFVIDRDAAVGDGAAAKQVIENELIQNTKAFQNDNIVYLDPNYWYLSGGGLISVAEMVKEITEAIK